MIKLPAEAGSLSVLQVTVAAARKLHHGDTEERA